MSRITIFNNTQEIVRIAVYKTPNPPIKTGSGVSGAETDSGRRIAILSKNSLQGRDDGASEHLISPGQEITIP